MTQYNQASNHRFTVTKWQNGELQNLDDDLIEEVPVALVYNGISHVVMMITPQDFEDFAIGFSLTEGIIEQTSEILDIEIAEQAKGIEVLLTITTRRFVQLKQVRRNLTGRTGCGLCGAESLQQAIRPIAPLSCSLKISDTAVQVAVKQLEQFQPLQALTGACHGAAWCDLEGEVQQAKEDVGRHNALDKLIGALHQNNTDLRQGFVLVSSRTSYEMVQKSVSVGIGALVSVSAPTAFAVRLAQQSQLKLIGFARANRHIHYT